MDQPTFDVTLQPGWLSRNDDPKDDYHAVWLYPTSPSTPYRAPNGSNASRLLLLDPRYTDSSDVRGHDEWWFIIERAWDHPALFDPMNHGKWGRTANFHNVAGDAGPNGGVGWSFGDGSSSLALDWLKRANPTIGVGPAALNIDLPVPPAKERQTYVLHFIAGRTDGTTPRAGALTVYVNGKEHWKRENINTVQRAQGPDGQWYVQRWMELWEGDYTSTLPRSATTRLVLTRIGKTLEEALADRPTVRADLLGSLYQAYGSAPKPTITAISPPWRTEDARVPGSSPEPPAEPAVTSTVKDGDTVDAGAVWEIKSTPAAERVEFWADGERFADLPAGPWKVPLALNEGAHALGVCVWVGGVRHVISGASQGVYARITVKAVVPPDPLGVRVIGTPTAKAVTLAWNVLPEQDGYLLLLDGQEVWPDGKRHASMSETVGETRVGRPQDGKPHRYGVRILGSVKEGEVTV